MKQWVPSPPTAPSDAIYSFYLKGKASQDLVNAFPPPLMGQDPQRTPRPLTPASAPASGGALDPEEEGSTSAPLNCWAGG